MNTYFYIIYHILLGPVLWALSNASLIVRICPVVHEILASGDFTVTDDLISRLFVVAFVHLVYMQIALIWGFTAQLSLWKLVHWLWRYKLNKVCDRGPPHKPFFIAINNQRQVIIGPNKKLVVTYVVGELEVLVWFMETWILKMGYCYNWYLEDAT